MASTNKQGQFWDRVTEQAQPLTEALRLIETLLPLDSIRGRDVLDAGCGAGDYSTALAQIGARSVTGLDVSTGSLQLAKTQTPVGNFVQASLSELPYRDESFDAIWSWGVLHYVPNTYAALHEIARVLRPGGVAVIHTIRASLWATLERAGAKLFSSAPGWVEPLVLSTGERIIPLVSQAVTGHSPEAQTSKSVRQKLHERLFVPGETHMFTFEQLAAGFGTSIDLTIAHAPVADLLKRDMSLTLVARKRG
ncbi:MAG: class I SAM-dependent methyltransferase [Chloroflexota bacterium]